MCGNTFIKIMGQPRGNVNDVECSNNIQSVQENGIMIKHKLFLRWWLVFTSILTGITIFTLNSGWSELYNKDATKLSFVIIAMFISMSEWCGYKTWRISRFTNGDDDDPTVVKNVKYAIETGWFTSDLCLTIGMMGTVIGFIMMLSGFTKVDVSDVNTVQELIKSLGIGMSTALYSTLTGLICSALLKIQYFNLNQAVEKAQ